MDDLEQQPQQPPDVPWQGSASALFDPVVRAVMGTDPGVKYQGWSLDDNPKPDVALARMQDLLRTHAIADRSYAEAKGNFGRYFPGVEPPTEDEYARWQGRATQETKLEDARAKVASEPLSGGPIALRRMVSFPRDLITSVIYGKAQKRLNAGTATDTDFRDIALYEDEQRRRGADESTWGGFLAAKVQELPSQVAGFYLGGAASKAAAPLVGLAGKGAASALGRTALTVALTPNLGLQQAVQSNVQGGRDPFDVRGMAIGEAKGIAELVVLHAAGKLTAGRVPQNLPAQVVAAGLSGPFAQQGADLASYGLGLQTHYGTLEDLVNGRRGDAAKKVVNDALTFAAFAAMHGGAASGRKLMDDVRDAYQEAARKGDSTARASEKAEQASNDAKPDFEDFGQQAPPEPPPGPQAPPGGAGQAAAPTPPPKAPTWDKLYRTLGVDRTATAAEITAAYRRLVKVFHPDRGGDPEAFKAVQHAYDVLTDAKRRTRYDGYGKGEPSGEPPVPPEQPAAPEPQQAAPPEPQPAQPAQPEPPPVAPGSPVARPAPEATQTPPEVAAAPPERPVEAAPAVVAPAAAGPGAAPAPAPAGSEHGMTVWPTDGPSHKTFTDSKGRRKSTARGDSFFNAEDGQLYQYVGIVNARTMFGDNHETAVLKTAGGDTKLVPLQKLLDSLEGNRQGRGEIGRDWTFNEGPFRVGQPPAAGPEAGKVAPPPTGSNGPAGPKPPTAHGPTPIRLATRTQVLDLAERPEAGLTERELAVLKARVLFDDDFRTIGRQVKVSHEQARQDEAKALKKLGFAGKVEDLHKENLATSVFGRLENGQAVAPGELHNADPDGRKVYNRRDQRVRLQAQLEKLANKLVGGKDSVELRAEAERLGQELAALDAPQPGEDRPPQRRPRGPLPEPRPVKPAPLRRGAGAGAAPPAGGVPGEGPGGPAPRDAAPAPAPAGGAPAGDIAARLNELGGRAHLAPAGEVQALVNEVGRLDLADARKAAEGFGLRLRKGIGKAKVVAEVARKLSESREAYVRTLPIAHEPVGQYHNAADAAEAARQQQAWDARPGAPPEKPSEVGEAGTVAWLTDMARSMTPWERKMVKDVATEFFGHDGAGAIVPVVGQVVAPRGARGVNAQARAGAWKHELRSEIVRRLTGQEYDFTQSAVAQALRAGHSVAASEEALQRGVQAGVEAARAQAADAQGAAEPVGGAQPAHAGDTGGRPATGDASELGHAGDPGGFDPAEFGADPGPAGGGALGGVARNLAARNPRTGQIALPTPAQVQAAVETVKSAARWFDDGFSRVAGRMMPATTRLDRVVGEAFARRAGARTWAKLAAEHYDYQIQGDATEGQDRLHGAALTEFRLRYMEFAFREASRMASNNAANARLQARQTTGWQSRQHRAEAVQFARQATKYMASARGVKSVIGPDSPLKSPQDYAAALHSVLRLNAPPRTIAEYVAAVRSFQPDSLPGKWKGELVPVMNDLHRTAQGLQPNDPINTLTQIPGFPINLKHADETTPGAVKTTGGGRGNLRNLKFKRSPFAREATGAADAYDLSLRAMIANSLEGVADIAAKAEAARAAVARGVGMWEDGRQVAGYVATPFTRPPQGTQKNAPGKDTFYLKKEAADEWRALDDVDKPAAYVKVLRAISNLPVLAALSSSVEVAYHSANLLTFPFTKPGVRPGEVIHRVYQSLFNRPEARKALLELARMGATKDEGPKAGALFSILGAKFATKYKRRDPTYYAGQFLERLGEAMRLAGSDAFDRLAAKGLVENTEANKRDFINQLGQYHRKAQNSLVVWLRDTGIGPFAVAGTNYNYGQGVPSLWLKTGLKATSWKAQARLRAEVFAKVAAVFGFSFLANYLMWGRVDGDDVTPFGAIKVGTDKNGKTASFDLTPLALVKRGLRAVGLLALIEGNRQRKMPGEAADRAVKDIVSSFLHPAMGPGYNLAHTFVTGEDTSGHRVAPHARKGESQYLLNAIAALENVNPTAAAALGLDQSDPKKLVEWYEKVSKGMGPFGPKFTEPPKKRR